MYFDQGLALGISGLVLGLGCGVLQPLLSDHCSSHSQNTHTRGWVGLTYGGSGSIGNS